MQRQVARQVVSAKGTGSNSRVWRGRLAPFANVVGPLRSAAVASRGLSPIMSVSFVLPVPIAFFLLSCFES